jgi:hypothetical protein
MKKTLLTLMALLFTLIVFSQNNTLTEPPTKHIKKYTIIYISEGEYETQMQQQTPELLWKYLKKGNTTFALFHSLEEAMGNMRGYQKRERTNSNEPIVYILSDYCCADNGTSPSVIWLDKENNIHEIK